MLFELIIYRATVIIEAMDANKPVVGTNVGGVPEFLRHNVIGFIGPPNDPIALADAIGKLTTAPEKAAKMGTLA